MRPVSIFLAITFAAIALAGTIWIGRYGGQLPVSRAQADGIPEVVTEGPLPKAVINETEYQFGIMEHGATGRHTFVVRNDGEGILRLAAGKTTCQCTVSSLEKDALEPGESIDIEVGWEIKSETSEFEHSATIHTSDPANPEIRLVIRGTVGQRLQFNPSEIWQIGTIVEDEPTEITGSLSSHLLEDFQVLGVDSENPLVEAAFEPFSEEDLSSTGAKSGWHIRLSVTPKMDLGRFRDELTVRTDVDGATEMKLRLEGHRPGPFRMVGRNWSSTSMTLNAGAFPVDRGFTETLTMYVQGDLPELEILEAESNPPFVNVKLEPGEQLSERARSYILTFTVPPGSPPVPYNRENPAKVTIKTNHPTQPTITFRLTFVGT